MRHGRVIGYARVSSKQQAEGSSLSDQQAAIRAHAKSLGLEVARMYVESESAVHEKSERREQIRGLMRDVRKGDLVLVDKLDRWSRDPEFTYGSVRRILEAGASWYAVAERCDPSTPEGDTALGFRVLFAREEHKRIRERTVGTRKLLRAKGWYVEGQLPYGYRRSAENPHLLEPNPDQADRVVRVFELAANGQGLAQIEAATGMERSCVHKRLRNRIYLGEIQSEGRWIQARHPAIIDPRLFAAAQRGLQSRRHRPAVGGETDEWMLRDVAVCAGCGARMTSAYGGRPPAGRPRRYYYRCRASCGAHLVPVLEAEADVDARVLERLATMVSELAHPPERRKVSGMRERLLRLEGRRARLVEMYSDGIITREKLDADMARLEVEKREIQGEEMTQAERRDALSGVREIQKAWKHATGAERRRIVALLADQARVGKGRRTLIVWRSPEELRG